uniref:G_PROTEIN_RECEP_F1_2 domain-containing protein n=1 Tax=Ascaris lumbricoides TaxID=6252 RepID=A0A0M3IFN9_ASCLU
MLEGQHWRGGVEISFTAETLTPVAMLTVSVDRLVSVVFPIDYFRHPRLIQTIEVSVGCSFVAVISVQSWIVTFPDVEEQFPPVCLTSHSWQPFHDDLIFAMKVFASCGSVLVYIAVFVVSQKHISRVKDVQRLRGQAALSAFQKRQRQLTISMGISCFFTMILYVLPTCIKYAFAHFDNVNLLDIIAIYSVVSSYLNPLANLAILFIRQVDIRNAICTCPPMRFTSLCSVKGGVNGVSTHVPRRS